MKKADDAPAQHPSIFKLMMASSGPSKLFSQEITNNGATKTCDACGLPPSPNTPLLQCTRCKRAHYHDRRCQREHYPEHKAECRRIAASDAAASSSSSSATASDTASPPQTTTFAECRTVEGRGRSLIATSSMSIGSHPLTSLCEPIAHPVLLESHRTSRCSYCFKSIRDDYCDAPDDARRERRRLHRHCSPKCESLDGDWIGEERASHRLPSAPSPTALSCARILRRFDKSPTTTAARDKYDELCHDANTSSEEEGEAYLAILTQCRLFLLAMGDASGARLARDLIHPDPSRAIRFMSRMSMNGFTISDSEQLPIGHGVYLGASAINHSCRPNCVQTFWIRLHAPPMLRLTACRTIRAGDEITIGYCDVSAPRHVRRESLWKNYKFLCDCPLCCEDGGRRDDDVVGLKCASDGCEGAGAVRCIITRSKNEYDEIRGEGVGPDDGRRLYKCDACGNTDFRDAIDNQAESIERMKRLELAMNNSGGAIDDRVGEEMRRIYERLKGCCRPQTSFYIAWSADICVCWYANALKILNSEGEQLIFCHRALELLRESRQATRFCLDYPGSLSWHVKRGKEAKLRLFVNPMDAEAMGMLRNVRDVMLMYYPPSDDLISSLDESLRAYSFS